MIDVEEEHNNRLVNILFIPSEQTPEFISAANEYDSIWKKHGQEIIQAMEEETGYEFREKNITARIKEEPSMSGRNSSDPMILRASYPRENKLATLVHELGHRHLFGIGHETGYDSHQVLDLFLYDLWVRLYGEEFANKQVETESKRKGIYNYDDTWKQTLAKTSQERKELLNSILKKVGLSSE